MKERSHFFCKPDPGYLCSGFSKALSADFNEWLALKGYSVCGNSEGYNAACADSVYFILSGKVNLVAAEPLTKEKLWAKSIPLKQKQVFIAPFYKSPDKTFNVGFSHDPGVINPMIDALQDYYKQVFNTS